MERIAKSLSKQIRGIKIYIEGLEDVFRIMSENTKEVSISTDRYKFDSFEEFVREFERTVDVNKVRFSASNPLFIVEFGEGEVRIYADRGDILATGLFQQVEEAVLRWRPITSFLKDGRMLFAYLIVMNAFSAFGENFVPERAFTITSFAMALLFPIWAVYLGLRFFPRFSRVAIPRRRYEERGFFQRNKDNLILVLVGALAGAAFTIFGSYLIDNYKGRLVGNNGVVSEFNSNRIE